MPLGIPTGALRAPRSNAFSFVFQSFLDEVAHRGGQGSAGSSASICSTRPSRARAGRNAPKLQFDPKRMRDVVARGARDVGLGRGRPKAHGVGMGVAFQFSHRGYFAEVPRCA